MTLWSATVSLILRGWLDWTDIVRLETSSCHDLLQNISHHWQSEDFQHFYGNFFESLFCCDSYKVDSGECRLLHRLHWVQKRKVKLNNCEASIVAEHFSTLEIHDNLFPFRFITKATLYCDSIESFVQVALVLSDAFPCLVNLTLIGEDVTVDMLRGLLILARSLPLQALKFAFNADIALSPQQTHMLCKVIAQLGPHLLFFSVPDDWILYPNVFSCLTDCCSNLKQFPFSNCSISLLTIEQMIRMICGKLTKLTKLVLLSHPHNHLLTNDDISTIASCLPQLEVFRVVDGACAQLKMRAGVTVLHHCGQIREITMLGVSWKKKVHRDDVDRLYLSHLSVQGLSGEKVSGADFLDLLDHIPPLTTLTFRCIDTLVCRHLSAALTVKHTQAICRIIVSVHGVLSLECLGSLTPQFSHLQELKVIGDLDRELSLSSVDYLVRTIQACQQLRTLYLQDIVHFTDAHVQTCLVSLPSLHTIELQGMMKGITNHTLLYLTEKPTVWQHINLWGTTISLLHLVQAIEVEHLSVKKLDFQHDACKCSVGYGKVPVRVLDLIYAVL